MTDHYKKALVSVIVPVYNIGTYLPRCLASIGAQTYAELEIILVDDGSTDNSVQICDEFVASDKRARVIHQVNQGDFAARDKGLHEAHGEYVYFIDGDDQIREKAIEIMVRVMEDYKSNLVICDFKYTNSMENDLSGPDKVGEVEWIPIEKIVFDMLSNSFGSCVVWNKLYKHSILEGISFSRYHNVNDQDFNLQVYQRIEKAAFVHNPLHYYVQSANSITRSQKNQARRNYNIIQNRFKMLDHVQPGKWYVTYRAWILDYGYRQILSRMKVTTGTEYEIPYKQLSRSILRTTGKEYRSSKLILPLKKIRFYLWWYFPHLGAAYLRIATCIRKKDND